jgi:hypothetical protein
MRVSQAGCGFDAQLVDVQSVAKTVPAIDMAVMPVG